MTKGTKFRILARNEAEAEQLTRELARQIEAGLSKLPSSDKIQVQTESANPTRQDFGTILAIVLAGPAVVEVARIIANYATGRGHDLEIELPSGAKITLKNADRDTVERTIRAHAQG
jgi:ferric-dicitrate binding protein FerR (iron transport regulator)